MHEEIQDSFFYISVFSIFLSFTAKKYAKTTDTASLIINGAETASTLAGNDILDRYAYQTLPNKWSAASPKSPIATAEAACFLFIPIRKTEQEVKSRQ